MSIPIAVEHLRIGMFIHLDGGWLSHPFALSSFRITQAEQLTTLRGLRMREVRWSPEKSELGDSAEAVVAGATQTPAPPEAAATPAELAARQRRELLAAQRAAQQLCERQYGEAAEAWRGAADAVVARPADARAGTEALTRALLAKMLGDGDVCIRLVNGGGDRAGAHALNVAVVSLLMGRAFGLTADELLDLGVGALLHDVGKQSLPERLRHADDRLGSADLHAYREHVSLGLVQGRRMQLTPGALAVLAQHHEHADGSGFPLRMVSDRMTTAARIVALVNRYDNLCNPPLLARAATPHEAVSVLFAQGRTRFDAAILNAFIRMMGVYPAGSLVQLTDDRYALVVAVNSSRPLKPRVLVHEPKAPRNEALLLDLQQEGDLGVRRSVPASRLPEAALDYLGPKPRVTYFVEPAPPAAAVRDWRHEVAA